MDSMSIRQFIQQAVNFGMIVASALIIWKSLMYITYTESPIVVVLSGSMEPEYYRGDLLFLWYDRDEPIKTGDVVVYSLPGRVPDIPIVHRALNIHTSSEGKQVILTKGDANPVDDRGLYNQGQLWLLKEHIIGRVRGYLPYVGYVTILMNDFPVVKYLLIGSLFIFVVISREN